MINLLNKIDRCERKFYYYCFLNFNRDRLELTSIFSIWQNFFNHTRLLCNTSLHVIHPILEYYLHAIMSVLTAIISSARNSNYAILMLFNCEVILILSLEHVTRYGSLNYLLKSAVISFAVERRALLK